MTWQAEEDYVARRAEKLKSGMLDAIDRKDKEAFLKSYEKSFRYMPKSMRSRLCKIFLAEVMEG